MPGVFYEFFKVPGPICLGPICLIQTYRPRHLKKGKIDLSPFFFSTRKPMALEKKLEHQLAAEVGQGQDRESAQAEAHCRASSPTVVPASP